MPCKYGKPSGTFSKYVTQEGLKCEHVRELLMKSKDVDTSALVVSSVLFLNQIFHFPFVFPTVVQKTHLGGFRQAFLISFPDTLYHSGNFLFSN